jgi:1-acyl-sn-glycerol-3-phosphate acyltransferase
MWPRHSFLKYPGKITVSIGRPIDPAGMRADALNKAVEDWIEAEVIKLGNGRSAACEAPR